MATLKPFRGLRYNTDKVKISQVIAPPYDVISPEGRDNLYRLSAYNVVRLILGKDEPSDHETGNRYTRAKAFFESWMREGVLIEDEKPCLYLYEQIFKHPLSGKEEIRRSIFSLLKLENLGEGVVFPHEKTYAKPKADRLHLLRETHANLSPVFGLYEDNDGSVNRALAPFYKTPGLFEARDEEKVVHKFWKIEDAGAIEQVTASFRSKKIVLADGHHRYETALNHRKEEGKNGESSCDYVLISLVDIHDPGLLVLPTHRLLKKPAGFNFKAFLANLGAYFDLVKTKRERLMAAVDGLSTTDKGFGLYLGGDAAYLAKLKSLAAVQPFAPKGRSAEWAGLEVSILSYIVMEKVLGLREEQFEDYLGYTRSDAEAFAKVDSDEFAAGFIMRSIPVGEIQKVCERKDLLPHKSTYFYPKLASGLVFYRHH